MIVVADASPLNYLILIGQAELLPRLFGEVFVPPAVQVELTHERAPELVRTWAAQPPAWVLVRGPARVEPDLRLGPGETEAIFLAEELDADLLLIDERRGTKIAKQRGLSVVSVLGILELAAERGWIALPDVIRKLRATTCRLSQRIIDEALERDRARGRAE